MSSKGKGEIPLYSEEEASILRGRLGPHIDMPQSNKPLEGIGTLAGAYTAEEAEQWIAAYRDEVER